MSYPGNIQCPVCEQVFGRAPDGTSRGLSVHMGRKHAPRKCRWSGDNRGWCVSHDAPWRIDRATCEGEDYR